VLNLWRQLNPWPIAHRVECGINRTLDATRFALLKARASAELGEISTMESFLWHGVSSSVVRISAAKAARVVRRSVSWKRTEGFDPIHNVKQRQWRDIAPCL
jgi:hypothetical protein